MSTSNTAVSSSTSVYTTPAFWERLWRTSGIQSVVLFIIAYVIYGYQPQIGAPTDALVAFYNSNRTRILIAAIFSGMAVLNLMWFAAALRTTLADAGQDGWGSAATASSAAVGALLLLLVAVSAALAYSNRRIGKSLAHIGTQRPPVGVRRAEFVPAGNADHGCGSRALARKADLERALRGGSGSHRPRFAGWYDVAEQRILGTGRHLFPARLADHRTCVGSRREPGPLNSKPRCAPRMVIPLDRRATQHRQVHPRPRRRQACRSTA